MEPPEDLSDLEYAQNPQTTGTDPSKPVQSDDGALKQTKLKVDRPTPAQFLERLNEEQRKAVTASPEGGLAVHAGPGSGKTAVLTTRVAYLVEERKMPPEQLVVVTFTNKAANEMKVRLCKMIGAETVDKLVMGTFHSVCVRYLRKYGKLVGLESNFLISDRDDCLAVIKRLLPTLPIPEKLRKEMKPNTWLEYISRCKSRMQTPEQYRAERAKDWDQDKVEAVVVVYEAYEEALSNNNALDFDDLLVRGLQLFRDHPRVVAKIKSVLIDEFQDTNSVQYDIVKYIAAASNSLTIVGDPDQSIYGWRNAEIENLEKMLKDFKPVQQIFLEQNYRSTGAILGAALAIVRQDTKRINKSLTTSHPSGSSVVLHSAPSAPDEATFIASTIHHLMAHLGGLVNYNDFAILLRYGALSRNIETALQKAGIPSRMVGGHKFFERTEIKDMLSYLQLISNPSYSPALARVLNIPRRGIGDKTQAHIVDVAAQKGIPAFEICVRIAKGQNAVSGLTGAQKKGIKALVEVVRDARKKADEGTDVATLIDLIVDRVGYRAHLDRTQAHDAARWENIMELKVSGRSRFSPFGRRG
ncbi:UvrD/REP type DNA helicase [Rhodotorula sp. JG-1b]|nr:UvrD/REP type DNA helicase [Rhodotorula sp. JG-1b]